MKRSRRMRELLQKINRTKEYPLLEGLRLVKECANANFDETVEMAVNLGVNPRHSDQMVRGAVTLPHGTGKPVRVLVLAKGPKADEAREAGADYVGFEEYIEKIKQGWTDVDVVITTPDSMPEVGKLGRILGPRGLMPNPKSGTVTNNVAEAVRLSKAGRVEFRTDRHGVVHTIIGKASFDEQKLMENAQALVQTLLALKPATAKGQYLKRITLSSSMGPGIRIDRSTVTAQR